MGRKNNMNCHYSHVSAFRLLLMISVAPALVAAKVKIFILIGQSNMYGQAKIEHLHQLKDSQPDEYNPFFNKDSTLSSRSDVRISSSQIFGSKGNFPASDLAVGAGMRFQGDNFGPELGFGWAVGDAYDEPILLVKVALGGTHLGVEWRSPSAPPIDYGGDFGSAEYGSIWRLMNLMVESVTANLERYVPGHGNDGYDISGILWMQGWNDAFNYPMRDDYEVNLSYFVQDLLDTFGSNVPILIAELGQEGVPPQQYSVKLTREAQINVVNAFALPNVVFLPTSPYVVTTDPRFDGVHHYYGRADTMIQIGKAFGREIIRQQQQLKPPSFASKPTASPVPAPSDRPAPSPINTPVATPPSPPSCTATGDGCTFSNECCSGRCHLLVFDEHFNGGVVLGDCWERSIAKSAVKYGSDRGGVNGSGGS